MAASSDEFIKKAYEELEKLGQDEHSMREYELRLMAIRDEQARIQTAEERGEQRGIQLGIEQEAKRKNIEHIDALLDILDDATIAEKLKVELSLVQERRQRLELS